MSTASIAAPEAFQYIFLERPQTTLGVHPGLRLKWNKELLATPCGFTATGGRHDPKPDRPMGCLALDTTAGCCARHHRSRRRTPQPCDERASQGHRCRGERVDCRTDLQSRRAPRIPELVFAGESPIGSPELRRLPPRSRCHCSPKAHSAGISAGVFLNPPRPCRCSHWSRG